MASMKLWKPNHGYGSNQSKMSQYQHQEYNMSQSSQSHPSHLGSSIHAFDQFDRACAKNSTRYHAQANSVLPTPSIHVQETNNVTQILKRQESHTDQQWSTKNDTCPNPARSCYFVDGATFDDAHRIGKMERVETLKKQESHTDQQWATKNDTCPIPAKSCYSASGAMYDDAQRIGKMEHGMANKATQFSSYGQANQHGQSMFNSQDDKSYKYNTNALDAGECLSPMNASHHGQTMFKEQSEQSYNFGKNSFEGDWTSNPNSYSGSNQFNHSTQNNYKQQDRHDGWNGKANEFYGSAEMGHSNHAIHQEGLMMGSKDQGWVNSPTQPSQSSLAIHKNHQMTEKMGHALVNSPTRANSSTFNIHKEDQMLGEIDGGLGMKSTNFSNGIEANSINDHEIHNSQSKNSGRPYQYVSSNTMYNGQNQYGQSKYQGREEDVFNFNDGDIESDCINKPGQKQYSYSSNNMHKGQEQNGSATSQSVHSGRPYQYGTNNTMYNGQDQHGQSIYHGREEDVFNFNDRDCIDNLGHKQYNYSSNNMRKGKEQYGSMISHTGHSAYSKHHGYEDAENVDDIMDEILSKYPAHNVSSGYGSCASRPKQFSYASSTSSSSAKKFEMRGTMNNGGFYKNGIGNYYGRDY